VRKECGTNVRIAKKGTVKPKPALTSKSGGENKKKQGGPESKRNPSKKSRARKNKRERPRKSKTEKALFNRGIMFGFRLGRDQNSYYKK